MYSNPNIQILVKVCMFWHQLCDVSPPKNFSHFTWPRFLHEDVGTYKPTCPPNVLFCNVQVCFCALQLTAMKLAEKVVFRRFTALFSLMALTLFIHFLAHSTTAVLFACLSLSPLSSRGVQLWIVFFNDIAFTSTSKLKSSKPVIFITPHVYSVSELLCIVGGEELTANQKILF